MPLLGHAQQPATPVIGFLSRRTESQAAYLVSAFREGLYGAGYKEGPRFELIINSKTTKALGLTISPGLLARADEVIE